MRVLFQDQDSPDLKYGPIDMEALPDIGELIVFKEVDLEESKKNNYEKLVFNHVFYAAVRREFHLFGTFAHDSSRFVRVFVTRVEDPRLAGWPQASWQS